jgi:hypothetical protein
VELDKYDQLCADTKAAPADQQDAMADRRNALAVEIGLGRIVALYHPLARFTPESLTRWR